MGFQGLYLVSLFYRFISDNLQNYINTKQQSIGFDYADLSDEEDLIAKEEIVKIKGFYILPSQLFCNLLKD